MLEPHDDKAAPSSSPDVVKVLVEVTAPSGEAASGLDVGDIDDVPPKPLGSTDFVDSVQTHPSDDVALTFPQRLMEILDDEQSSDIVGWLPHGRAFVIFRKQDFETDVLPRYFHKQSKYSSFTRKLNRWGFVRVTRGPETGAYYHRSFKRGEHRLCSQMSCRSIAKTGGSASSDAHPVFMAQAHHPGHFVQYQQQSMGPVSHYPAPAHLAQAMAGADHQYPMHQYHHQHQYMSQMQRHQQPHLQDDFGMRQSILNQQNYHHPQLQYPQRAYDYSDVAVPSFAGGHRRDPPPSGVHPLLASTAPPPYMRNVGSTAQPSSMDEKHFDGGFRPHHNEAPSAL